MAYTFDAGPNACLYMENKDVPEVAALIQYVFPPAPNMRDKFFTGMPVKLPSLSKVIVIIAIVIIRNVWVYLYFSVSISEYFAVLSSSH